MLGSLDAESAGTSIVRVVRNSVRWEELLSFSSCRLSDINMSSYSISGTSECNVP